MKGLVGVSTLLLKARTWPDLPAETEVRAGIAAESLKCVRIAWQALERIARGPPRKITFAKLSSI